MSLMVRCEGLVHIYRTAGGEVVALQGLDLDIRAGETVAIVGRSGSGKTTLMNILAGVEQPTAGTAEVAGQDLGRLSESGREAYRRHKVGYLWQHALSNTLPGLSMVENVMAPMVPLLAQARARKENAVQLLEAVGLMDRVDAQPTEATGGENQRLALAIALANGPDLLLADEPTAELDTATSRELLADLSRLLKDRQTSAILVTHDQLVERFVDRVVQIRDGRTSMERRWVDQEGQAVPDEVVILDRAGRLQLPQAFVTKLGLTNRVRVRLDGEGVRIIPADREAGT